MEERLNKQIIITIIIYCSTNSLLIACRREPREKEKEQGKEAGERGKLTGKRWGVKEQKERAGVGMRADTGDGIQLPTPTLSQSRGESL